MSHLTVKKEEKTGEQIFLEHEFRYHRKCGALCKQSTGKGIY